jgi:hypothetical protein
VIDNDGDPMAAAPAGALILRADALDMGVNADDIKRRLERGHWVSVRPGAYLRAATDAALTPRQRHLLQINATMAAGGEHLVVSHRSAACLHGFELLTIPGRTVHVTNGEAAAGRRTRLRHTYCAPLGPDEIVVLGGHRVTSPARTLVDLARSGSFEEALVATDHALHHQRVSRDELRASMDRAPRRKGMRSARQVVVFADGRAESAGESRSRLLIARQLLPVPDLQVAIRTRNGVVVAHSDFGWPQYRTVGEFDGFEKYSRSLRPGESVGDRIHAEKIREDLIRELGWNVVRWTWSELDEPEALAQRIRRGLVRGGLRVGA